MMTTSFRRPGITLPLLGFTACLAGLASGLLVGCGGDPVRPLGGAGGAGLSPGSDAAGARDGGTAGGSGSGGRTGGSAGESAGGGDGSGGVVGSGGRIGTATGGLSGSGGNNGSGAANGSGGNSGPNPSTCDQLAAEYRNEMPTAKVCTIGIGLSQCQIRVSLALGCDSVCTTYVQTATELNELKSKWVANRCDSLQRACPAVACAPPQPGNCVLSPSSRTPHCQDGPVLTSD